MITLTIITPVGPGISRDDLDSLDADIQAAFPAHITVDWRMGVSNNPELESLTSDGFDTPTTIIHGVGKNVANIRNTLIADVKQGWVLQLDADDSLMSDAGTLLTKANDTHCAAAFGKAHDVTDGEVTFTPPSAWLAFDRHIAMPGDLAVRRRTLGAGATPSTEGTPYPTLGAGGFYRASALHIVRGWDEHYGSWQEDAILMGRLQRSFPIYCNPNLVTLLYHRHPGSLMTADKTAGEWQAFESHLTAIENWEAA